MKCINNCMICTEIECPSNKNIKRHIIRSLRSKKNEEKSRQNNY